MARKENQKLKLLYLMRIFIEKTDDNHSITMPEIIEQLKRYNIEAERKSIYNDISYLREFGYDIIGEKVGKGYSYHMGERKFEFPELKLLVDSVQSAKFITEKKSKELIKKLETMCSTYEASQLNRQVYVQGRIKTMNESILYNVDRIHEAIANNRKITFHYWNWNVDKKMELRHDGMKYKVSPWGLAWDDGNYYMVAFDDKNKIIKNYRVDKMIHINTTDEKREGYDSFTSTDMAEYTKKTFGMYRAKEYTVTIECENSFAGVMYDRFGKDVLSRKIDKDHFAIYPKVAVSDLFIGWIIGLGEGVKITGPEYAVKKMKEAAQRIAALYYEG